LGVALVVLFSMHAFINCNLFFIQVMWQPITVVLPGRKEWRKMNFINFCALTRYCFWRAWYGG